MANPKDACVQPAKGPIAASAVAASLPSQMYEGKEPVIMNAQVGKEGPDFEASAYVNGGFENIRFSNYKGKWIVLCFYPGDFTFV